MKIRKDEKLKQRFVEALRKKYGNIRGGVHVSDLVYCLREAYYRKVDPVPFTERTLGFFVDGARRHRVLQELLGVESEVKVEKWGVRGSIDVLILTPVFCPKCGKRLNI